MAHARANLAEAATATRAGDRYRAAHLGALRAAAAVVAAGSVRAGAPRPGRRLQNVWDLLARTAPELGEWAHFFAHGARARAAIEAGLPHVVTDREADDLLRDAETFVDLVTDRLGLPRQRSLAGAVAPLRAS
jgi:hypothetical protein